MTEERIQKVLARAGVASRRACEELIRQGRVTVNGKKAELGMKIDPARHTIRVDGEVVALKAARPVYILLNKPTGVVSAASAQRQEKRPTVRDLVPVEGRLFPVGRLDADSEGLILLTNDGDLTQHLTHPRYGHTKTYRVLVAGHPSQEQLHRWRAGVALDDGMTAPCQVRVRRRLDSTTWLEVTMREGRKRQIRRTANALGLHVLRLLRTKFGPLTLTGLAPGEWRYLTDQEIRELKRESGRKSSTSRRRKSGAPRKPHARRRTAGKQRKEGKEGKR